MFWHYNVQLKAPAAGLSMEPSKRKFDEEKSKHIGLAQQNGFGLAFFVKDDEARKRHSQAQRLLLIG
jgi:hypothetical protein